MIIIINIFIKFVICKLSYLKFSNDKGDRLLDNLESWVFYLFCSRCLKLYITFHESDFDQCIKAAKVQIWDLGYHLLINNVLVLKVQELY